MVVKQMTFLCGSLVRLSLTMEIETGVVSVFLHSALFAQFIHQADKAMALTVPVEGV